MKNIFKSAIHKAFFSVTMDEIGKIYDGKFDPEYAAALYILSADETLWFQMKHYIKNTGIDFEELLKLPILDNEIILIKLAANLFNGSQNINPVEFMALDEDNFIVAQVAIYLRYNGYRARGMIYE